MNVDSVISGMSALPPRATVGQTLLDVSKVPGTDIIHYISNVNTKGTFFTLAQAARHITDKAASFYVGSDRDHG